MVQLHRAQSEFEAAGTRLVMIGQATPRHASHFRRRYELEVPLLADEQRESYKAVGAKMANLNELLGPKIVAKGIATSRKYGVVQGKTIGHPAQLGGSMVIEPDGTVAWSHMSQDASDNAAPQEILDAARAASQAR